MKRFVKVYSVQVIGTDVHVDITSDMEKPYSYPETTYDDMADWIND